MIVDERMKDTEREIKRGKGKRKKRKKREREKKREGKNG